MLSKSTAALLLAFGCLLLAASVINFVSARDTFQAGESSADGRDGIVTAAVLTVAGISLCCGGLLIIVRQSPALMAISFGCTLLGGAWAQAIFSAEWQRRDQLLLDREWNRTVQETLRQDPRVLPGGRPAPAVQPGVGLRIGMLVTGLVLVGGGGVAAVWQSGHRPQV